MYLCILLLLSVNYCKLLLFEISNEVNISIKNCCFIFFLQPNGRFDINKKICLSISGHHPETWQPSWSIRTALLALIAFMPTPGNATIGSLDYSAEERQKLAKRQV